jgi:hypothetical protein
MTKRGPKPIVSYEGRSYSLRSRTVVVPALDAMTRIEALVWLNQHTCKRGHMQAQASSMSFGGALKVSAA